MHHSAVRRSACDQCRAKRVRCLRAQDSIAPCARCCNVGARCVTGASGQPGRPSKRRLASASCVLQESHVGTHPPAMAVVSACVRASKPTMHPHLPRDPVDHEPNSEFCGAPGDISAFVGSPFPPMSQSLAPDDAPLEDILSLADQLGSPSRLRGRLDANDELTAALHIEDEYSTALNLDLEALLGHEEHVLHPNSLPRCPSAASSLVKLREEINERIATIDSYYSDASKVMQCCKDGTGDRDIENPTALLLVYSKELTERIESLVPASQSHAQADEALGTEIVLLVLSCYLALMRLFDCLFHRIYTFICQVPPESYESLKVKSVLRIGGVSSLQDISLKAYAVGILDAIKDQLQVLEFCMGIPVEYCLTDKRSGSSISTSPGIFSGANRAQLFWAVMAQEDVRSQRGSKSYVESIRASIKQSMEFLVD